MRSKVIVVVGPTAVGKSSMAIALAKHYHLDIISGDSISVYQRLNIGSAKPSKEEMMEVKHHLIDILDPKEDYSVADFQQAARAIIQNKPLSLICGGTGLYIQATLFDYEFSSKKRDKALAEKYEGYTNEELYALLKGLDKNLDETKIHPNNRKRVLRALEVYQDLGQSIHSFKNRQEPLYDSFIIYLDMERELLYQRINERVDLMMQEGLFEEVKELASENIFPKGIGYREWQAYFQNERSMDEVIEEIKKNTRHLAKRQATWFKNQMDSHFYYVNETNQEEILSQIIKDIDRWLEQ
ncbi:MAG: tRNA (adenosine(37)-N6)-dimethylallyltransferase MiaA [Anaeroplasmataceae bacterium]|nr:tRNA (adenosine(37)-N6)-dimethylallyltransferase MiaA [Anaeroplasmataceae bacterium]